MEFPDISEIRKIRQRLGLTQSSLARQCGLSQSIIAKIEKGRCDPSYSTASRLFGYFEQQSKKGGVTAASLMSKSIVFISPRDSVEKAIMLMRKNSFSALPAIENGRAVGHISDDTIMRHLSDGKTVASWKCGQIMEEPFPRVGRDTPAEAVGGLLKYSKAVLVTRGEKVEGIITKADLLKLIKP